MEKLQTSETLRSLEARAQTLRRATTLAHVLVAQGVRARARFEPLPKIRGRRGQTDPKPQDGWLLGEGRRYLAGKEAGIGPTEPVWAREQLMLGEDGQLRTIYEEPTRDYRDDGRGRVFYDAYLEGWSLRESLWRKTRVLAVREHDAQGTRGDYFLHHDSRADQPLLVTRREEAVDVTNEQYVQTELGYLATEYGISRVFGLTHVS